MPTIEHRRRRCHAGTIRTAIPTKPTPTPTAVPGQRRSPNSKRRIDHEQRDDGDDQRGQAARHVAFAEHDRARCHRAAAPGRRSLRRATRAVSAAARPGRGAEHDRRTGSGRRGCAAPTAESSGGIVSTTTADRRGRSSPRRCRRRAAPPRSATPGRALIRACLSHVASAAAGPTWLKLTAVRRIELQSRSTDTDSVHVSVRPRIPVPVAHQPIL